MEQGQEFCSWRVGCQMFKGSLIQFLEDGAGCWVDHFDMGQAKKSKDKVEASQGASNLGKANGGYCW